MQCERDEEYDDIVTAMMREHVCVFPLAEDFAVLDQQGVAWAGTRLGVVQGEYAV